MNDLLLAVLGAMFLLDLGAFAYTFKVHSLVWTLANNHIKHLEARVKELERLNEPE